MRSCVSKRWGRSMRHRTRHLRHMCSKNLEWNAKHRLRCKFFVRLNAPVVVMDKWTFRFHCNDVLTRDAGCFDLSSNEINRWLDYELSSQRGRYELQQPAICRTTTQIFLWTCPNRCFDLVLNKPEHLARSGHQLWRTLCAKVCGGCVAWDPVHFGETPELGFCFVLRAGNQRALRV